MEALLVEKPTKFLSLLLPTPSRSKIVKLSNPPLVSSQASVPRMISASYEPLPVIQSVSPSAPQVTSSTGDLSEVAKVFWDLAA